VREGQRKTPKSLAHLEEDISFQTFIYEKETTWADALRESKYPV